MTKEHLDKVANEYEKEYTSDTAAYAAIKPIVEEYGSRADVNNLEGDKSSDKKDKTIEIIESVLGKILDAAETVKEDADEAKDLEAAYAKGVAVLEYFRGKDEYEDSENDED